MKRIIALLFVLLLMPLPAPAELQMETSGSSRILFPELDQMQARFRTVDEWTLVHKGLGEHLALLLKRGDKAVDYVVEHYGYGEQFDL